MRRRANALSLPRSCERNNGIRVPLCEKHRVPLLCAMRISKDRCCMNGRKRDVQERWLRACASGAPFGVDAPPDVILRTRPVGKASPRFPEEGWRQESSRLRVAGGA